MSILIKQGMPGDMLIPAPALAGMSEEEFFHFATQYPNSTIERDKHGNILIMPPVNPEGARREVRAISMLDQWNEQTGLGEVFSSSGAFTLPDGSVRSPDASWIAKERYYALPEAEREKFSRICPDFVIEVRSKSDSLRELQEKIEAYMANGAQLGFLIDPVVQAAAIYRADGSVEHFEGLTAVLSGEPVLPGFSLDLARFGK